MARVSGKDRLDKSVEELLNQGVEGCVIVSITETGDYKVERKSFTEENGKLKVVEGPSVHTDKHSLFVVIEKVKEDAKKELEELKKSSTFDDFETINKEEFKSFLNHVVLVDRNTLTDDNSVDLSVGQVITLSRI